MLLLIASLHAATPAAVEAYTEARWVRSAFVVTGAGVALAPTWDPKQAPVPWGVFDGGGRLLDAEAFATASNDTGMLARFKKEQGDKTATNVVATVVAVVAASAGSTFGGAPEFASGTKGSPDQAPAWSWIVGRRNVSDYYTAAVADELIVRHNASLRRQHGLSAEEAAAADSIAVGPKAAGAP